jgi:hypothetical protein
MRRTLTWLSIAALLGVGGTALAQALPALTAGAPPSDGTIAPDPALTLHVAEPSEIIIDAVATGVDAQLRLMHDGSFVAEDSDSGDGVNARLDQFLAPGDYQVIVYEYQYRAMSASVSAAVAPPMTPVATITPGATAAAIQTPEGDWARAASVEVGLDVATAGDYRLTAASTDAQCSPEITVIQNHAVQGFTITSSSGQPASDTRTLGAGHYTLRIRNWWNHPCAMSVTVTQ